MLKLLTEYVGQKVKKTFFNLVFFGLWDEPSGFDSRVGLFQLQKAHCLWSSTVQIVLVYCVYLSFLPLPQYKVCEWYFVFVVLTEMKTHI